MTRETEQKTKKEIQKTERTEKNQQYQRTDKNNNDKDVYEKEMKMNLKKRA